MDERTISGYNNRSYIIKWNGNTNTANCETDGSKFVASTISSLTSNVAYPTTIYMKAGLFGERCGVKYYSDNAYIYYNSTITVTYGKNPENGIIGREEYDRYNVTCLKNRTIEAKLSGDSFNVESRVDGVDIKSKLGTFKQNIRGDFY